MKYQYFLMKFFHNNWIFNKILIITFKFQMFRSLGWFKSYYWWLLESDVFYPPFSTSDEQVQSAVHTLGRYFNFPTWQHLGCGHMGWTIININSIYINFLSAKFTEMILLREHRYSCRNVVAYPMGPELSL